MVAALLCIFIGYWQNEYEAASFSYLGNYMVTFSYLVIYVAFSTLYGGFKVGVFRMREIMYSSCLSMVFTNFVVFIELCLIARDLLNPLAMVRLTMVQIVVILLCIYASNTVYFALNPSRDVMVIFDKTRNNDIIKKMSLIKERYTIKKGITIDKSFDEITKEIDKYNTILICDFNDKIKQKVLMYCYTHKKKIYLTPSTNDIVTNHCYQIQIFDSPMLFCRNSGLTIEQRTIKRTIDIVFSLFGIIISSPIMLILAIGIKLCDRGPILFKQKRITIDNKEFEILKFRSMIDDADNFGGTKALTDDKRITLVGKIMRPFRLDELPQLFNVLKGDMSLVGPRPERTEHVEEYNKLNPDFNLRHKVKAGLTGYAQIYGKYNTSPMDKLNLDLTYIESYSIFSDIKLMIMTIKILFMKESTEGFNEKEKK